MKRLVLKSLGRKYNYYIDRVVKCKACLKNQRLRRIDIYKRGNENEIK
jgi:hypothetical protein